MLQEPVRRTYTWRKIKDKSEFPPGLRDLIREAHVLVLDGAEYVGLFIHDEGRCWIGYRSLFSGEPMTAVVSDPDTARRRAEVLMDAGMVAPRRRSRF